MFIGSKETAKNMIVTTVAMAFVPIAAALVVGIRDNYIEKKRFQEMYEEDNNDDYKKRV